MIVKGTCQKQDLLQAIHDAILSAGSNWTEISSNKTNDFKWTGTMNDGYVFKSPPIGTKGQSVILNLKSIDLSVVTTSAAAGNGGNHFLIWLADDYVPNATNGINGTFTNKGGFQGWCFCQSDNINCTPTSLFDYIVDIEDHRILIVIQRHLATTLTYPQFLYLGYPDPTTNIEGSNYTNQFIVGSNIYNSNPGNGVGNAYWHKASNGLYNKIAGTICNLNGSNPNPMGLYLLTPITVTGDGGTGLINSGPLGVLSGLYGLPNTNIVNGDTITIGSDTYQVFALSQYAINAGASIGLLGAAIGYYNGVVPSVIAVKTN
ncbi:hypothetical protein JOC70_000754 [Clostridium pascui]|uniref:hypothetical protein n=1 Tax=Clostridium pascui TaxID=46609 RepID=UPI00195829D6|nr:hypothetical protein [Clostridium pascui]MBM7869285.1 hypothetical protein [Clostridium pascui]